MAEKAVSYDHSQIVEWLERKLRGEKTYRNLEESPEFQADTEEARRQQDFFFYPRLPIDLIWVHKKQELIDETGVEKAIKARDKWFNHYTLFFAAPSKAVSKDEIKHLKRRLPFYQFYLSRITEPKRFQVIVVLPYDAHVPEESLGFFKENGFGLWKVHIETEQEEEVCPPRTLRMRMIEEFRASVDNPRDLGETVEKLFRKEHLADISTFREAVKGEAAKDFAAFFDQYVLDAVDAIAGVTPSIFGERYIDRRLLGLVSELQRVSYRERLQELVNEHLYESCDDYEFVAEAFSILWEENIGIPYSSFLETFEPALLHVFAEGEKKAEPFYRDHYIHQFQVFLLGLYIMDKVYDAFLENNKTPETCWLVISSFHDMAYPVQLYDEWSKGFFEKVFSVPVELAHLELKSNFVDQSFLSCMGYLICSLYSSHKGETLKKNWLADKKELVRFFYQEITKEKNHCILSSISLLKIVQSADFNRRNTVIKRISNGGGAFDDILKNVFVPSALAIALHDKEVWQKLRKEAPDDRDSPPRILASIEFENDPLSFLLILCDSIQEWGRPSKLGVRNPAGRETLFYLRHVKWDPKAGFDITIWTPKHKASEQFFKDKQDELTSVQFFLKQPPAVSFTVHLMDKDNNGEDFTMQGPRT